ncbi:membrane dipeptidase-domain-containing protein [Xylaria acuta]|nr:membrane dipeptidase-domain-containing protein [Xylaria acuta]
MSTDKTNNVRDSIWYFAYGSNMRESVMVRRGIRPLAKKLVVVPSHVLCFDVFGVPYAEPAMASITARSMSAPSQPPVHGIAYALSASDFWSLIVSEGAGIAYSEVQLQATILDNHDQGAGMDATLSVRTLIARYPFCPNPLPSSRYLDLLIAGAEEHGLPDSYRTWLKETPYYARPVQISRFRDLGIRCYVAFWMRLLSWIMVRAKASADASGRVHENVRYIVWLLFHIMWWYHDFIHSWIFDGHNDFAYMIRGWFRNRTDQADFQIDDMPIGQTDIWRLRKGRLGGQFWSAFVPSPKEGDHPLDSLLATMQQIDLLHDLFERFNDVFAFVDKAADVIPAFHSGRIVSLIGIEGLHSVGQSASALRMLYRLGVRYATLCHNTGNTFADSATSRESIGGLSSKGKAMIQEMNRLGMIVDLSHTSHQTQLDALEVTRAPLIFSHSSCYSLCPNPRNVRDEVLLRLAENGGVIMICFIPSLVEERGYGDSGQLLQETTATVASVASHIVYVGTKIGYEHVGIGSDFDGMLEGPQGLEDTSQYPTLIAELLDRGLSEQEVGMVMGLNILRVLGDVEEKSRRLQEAGKWQPLCDDMQSPWTEEQRALLVLTGQKRKKVEQ